MRRIEICTLSAAVLLVGTGASAQPASGLQLVQNTPKIAADYVGALRILRGGRSGDLASTQHWLRRAEDAGAKLGRKPLLAGFKARMIEGGHRRDMQHGLSYARRSKARGTSMGLGLSRVVRNAQALKLTGDQLHAILRKNGLTAGDLARHTDYQLKATPNSRLTKRARVYRRAPTGAAARFAQQNRAFRAGIGGGGHRRPTCTARPGIVQR